MPIFHYSVHDEQFAVQIERDGNGYQVTIDDRQYTVSLHKQDDHLIAFTANGQRHQAAITPRATVSERQLWFDGHTWIMEKLDPRRQRRHSADVEESGALAASMPGQVQEILIAEGQPVHKGDPLLLLEAMKMEMRITAPADGVITTIHCAVGDVVERGQVLVVLEQK